MEDADRVIVEIKRGFAFMHNLIDYQVNRLEDDIKEIKGVLNMGFSSDNVTKKQLSDIVSKLRKYTEDMSAMEKKNFYTNLLLQMSDEIRGKNMDINDKVTTNIKEESL